MFRCSTLLYTVLLACNNNLDTTGGADFDSDFVELDPNTDIGTGPSMQWQQQMSFEVDGILPLPDGKMLIYGIPSPQAISAGIYDSTGQLLTKFDEPLIFWAHNPVFTTTADGGFLLNALVQPDYGSDNPEASIVRYDATGHFMWRVDRPANNTYVTSLLELPDGRILFSGQNAYPDGGGRMGVLSASGDTISVSELPSKMLPADDKTVTGSISNGPVIWWHRNDDGSIDGKGTEGASRYTPCGGDNVCAQSDAMLMQIRLKSDLSIASDEWIGGTLWTNLIGFADAEVAKDKTRWVAANRQYADGVQEALVFHEDSSNKLKSTAAFRDARGWTTITSIIPDGDGAIIDITLKPDPYTDATLLLRVDDQGTIVWQKNLRDLHGNLNGAHHTVVRLFDGTLVVARYASMPGDPKMLVVGYR